MMQARLPSPLSPLAEKRLDVLVIGGGLYGVSIAREALGYGLKVALVEKRGIGSGASSRAAERIGWKHFSTLWANLSSLRSVAHERLHLVRSHAPAVRLLPWLRSIKRQARAKQIQWHAFERLATLSRTAASPPWPAPRQVSAEAMQILLPGVCLQGTGEIPMIHEAVADVRRLSEVVAMAAARRGGDVWTRCEVIAVDALSSASGPLLSVQIRDGLTGTIVCIEARSLVLAVGIDTDRVRRTFGWGTEDLLEGEIVQHETVLRRTIDAGAGIDCDAEILPGRRSALIVDRRDGRTRDVLEQLFGVAAPSIQSRRVSRFAVMKKRKADKSFGDGSATMEMRHGVLCFTVVGGSAVFHRSAGRAVARRIAAALGSKTSASDRPSLLVPGGDMISAEGETAAARARGLSFEQAEWLVRRYGSLWKSVLEMSQERDIALGASAIPLACEVGWAIEHERVRSLSDLMASWHAPELGVDEERLLDDTASAMAHRLSWNDARLEREIARWRRERDWYEHEQR